MTVEISRELLASIRGAAAASAHETCGLLLGEGVVVREARPCRNVHPQPDRHFEIDPVPLLAAYRTARDGGLRVLGHYHSHPSGDPTPSVTDAANAAPDGTIWLIVAGGEAKAWRAVGDGRVHGRFEPVTILVAEGCAPDSQAPEPAAMPMSPVDFASLLCSRLCHDLLSPVGALNNGLELLADETDEAMRARCMELLAESARTSANKLKFFRLAFGAGGGFGDAVDVREARAAIEGLFGDNRRLTIGWLVEAETLPKAAVKALLNLVMIAGDALVRGGQLDIGAEAEGGTVELVLRASGPRIVLDEEIRGTLTGGGSADQVTPRAAPAFLVAALVAQGGGTVQVDLEAEALLVGATLSAR